MLFISICLVTIKGAVREAIANALIHQDFSITGTSVKIEIFSDRIEITNSVFLW